MSELSAGADSIPTDRTAIKLATRKSDTEPRLTLATPLPAVCAVHGRAAATTRAVWIRPPHTATVDLPRGIGSYLPGGSVFWQAMENLVKRLAEEPAVRADWPLCARCTSILRLRRLTAATLAIAGALAFMGAVVLGSVDIRGSGVTAAFVGGLCAIALSVPVVYTTRAERVLRATATPDGSAVIVADPHSKFAAAVRAERS